MGKKAKDKKHGKVVLKATPGEYRESALACAQLALWACDAFSLEQTAENAQAMYRLAWSHAKDHMEMDAFVVDPNGGR